MIYTPKKHKILEKKKVTEDTYFFRVKSDVYHLPGHFVEISVLGVGEAPISIASYKENSMDFLIRDVGNVTRAICKLKEGDNFFIRGPYGRGYPMRCFEGNEIILIGGGTGTAPLRGVIQYIQKNREKYRDIDIFLGFRDPKNILFKNDLKEWKSKFNLCLTVDKGDSKWKGKCGLITKILEKSKINNKNKIVLICGPPIMIKFTLEVLKKLGFNDDQIYLSLERHMKCGMGKCGRCMIHGKYTCVDGPVFRYDQIKDVKE